MAPKRPLCYDIISPNDDVIAKSIIDKTGKSSKSCLFSFWHFSTLARPALGGGRIRQFLHAQLFFIGWWGEQNLEQTASGGAGEEKDL